MVASWGGLGRIFWQIVNANMRPRGTNIGAKLVLNLEISKTQTFQTLKILNPNANGLHPTQTATPRGVPFRTPGGVPRVISPPTGVLLVNCARTLTKTSLAPPEQLPGGIGRIVWGAGQTAFGHPGRRFRKRFNAFGENAAL